MKIYTRKSEEDLVIEPGMLCGNTLDIELSRTGARRLAEALEYGARSGYEAVEVKHKNGAVLFISFRALDPQELEEMEPGEEIARGAKDGKKWIAVRGGGDPSWAIYMESQHSPQETFEDVRAHVDKVHDEKTIMALVNCTPAALGSYRH